MAHKKAGGSIAPNRDSQGQRRGVKLFGGQKAKAGSIIVRQCGTKFFPGKGTSLGRDYTVFARVAGTVKFTQKFGKKIVNITP